MSLNEEVELLRSVPLFANIEPSKLKLLAFTSERLTFPAGQDLCKQGDIGDAAYVIVSGDADVIIDTPSATLKLVSAEASFRCWMLLWAIVSRFMRRPPGC